MLNPKTNKIRITRDVNWGDFRSRQLDENMEGLFEPGVESDKEENDTSKTTEITTDETSRDEREQQEPLRNKRNRKRTKRKKKASEESDDTSSIEYINVREIWNKEMQKQEEDSTTSEEDVSTLDSGGISKSTISKPLMKRNRRNKERGVTMKHTSPLKATSFR